MPLKRTLSQFVSERRRFFFKAAVAYTILGVAAVAFFSRFGLMIDPQKNPCLPYRLYIVDTQDQSVKRGNYYAYRAKDMEPFYEDGTLAGKQFVGMPGDEIRVNKDQTFINDTAHRNGALHLVERLDQSPEDLTRETTLEDDEYFGMGTTMTSYDSRYWGPISKDQVYGRIYPIF